MDRAACDIIFDLHEDAKWRQLSSLASVFNLPPFAGEKTSVDQDWSKVYGEM